MVGDFEHWARQRSGSLLRTAFLLTGDQHRAEDLLQECLERVAAAWDHITDSPDGYARRVLSRQAARRWRRRTFREVLQADPPTTRVADETDNVLTRTALRAAMRRLTPRQRAVLVLKFYEDLSEAETASALGCSVGTVKSQTHKALQALRRGAPELAELVKEVTASA